MHTPGREFSFGVAGGRVSTRDGGGPPPTPSVRMVGGADMPKRKGFLSFMGC
jgi:hypothetical protein